MIKIYLYLINLEVSQSIHFNFNRQSTDNLPTDYQKSADMLPTVGRLSAERWLPLWKNCRLTVHQLSANSWQTVGVGELLFTFFFFTIPETLGKLLFTFLNDDTDSCRYTDCLKYGISVCSSLGCTWKRKKLFCRLNQQLAVYPFLDFLVTRPIDRAFVIAAVAFLMNQL